MIYVSGKAVNSLVFYRAGASKDAFQPIMYLPR